MNTHKRATRFLSVLLTGAMLLSTGVTASAASDMDCHWAGGTLYVFAEQGLLQGYGDGTYRPDEPMTRAQFAALVNRVTGLTAQADLSGYTDVPENAWYAPELAKALAAGYLQGTSDTTLSPETPVTREQAVTLLSRLLGLRADQADVDALNRYADGTRVSDWAVDAFAAMVREGYVEGMTGNTLSPDTVLTRAQGVTLLSRTMEALQAVSAGTFRDGVYTGTGAGYGGTITVEMTVENGRISKLEVLSHSDTDAFLNRAKTLLDTVLAKQDTEGVDAVSGATLSSQGLLTAVNACISQARGGEDTSKTGATGTGGGAGASTRPDGEDFSALEDGTYTGSAQGYSGTTTVTVTVQGGKITEITVDSHGDTESYLDSAKGVIPSVIENQSTDVDAVSGATYSSWGIINAVADALKDAIPPTETTYPASNWSEFTTALAKAVDGDTIQLTADITDAGEPYDASAYDSLVDAVSSATLGMATINKAVTIDGDGHSITAGTDMAYCFNISGSGVVMKNLTIDGASYGARMGGGLYLAGAHGSTVSPSLALENVTIKNCKSYKNTMPGNGGGAIYCKGTVTLTAANCTFAGNEVDTGLGGAILAQGANVTLTDCTFTGNKAPYGGAIAATGTANLTVTGSIFSGNAADNGGNDIYIFDGKTPGKSGAFSDSAVSCALIGNTYSADGDSWQDYAVVLGRYTADESADGGKNYVGSGAPFLTENGHDLTFTGWERTELAGEDATQYKYVLMNIPYADFYAAELNNTVAVDAVSSATKAKTRTGSLVGGSYHENSDGSDISGVIFPVVMKNDVELSDFTKVTDDTSVTITVTNRGQTSTTTYSGKDALFESASYSYYELSEAPTCFKVATLEDGTLSFGPVQGVTTALSGVKASLQTESSYGDYQINLMDGSNTLSADSTVYGVILSTREGNDYGLRHLENIWRGTELAFCTGFTEAVHGSPTSPAHYEAIMGQTITQITYLTDTGIYTIATELYVPVKFNGTLSVTDADVSAGTTAVSTNGFPVGYAAKISVANGSGEDVTNTHGFALTGSTLTWMGTPAIGAYTLTVSDTGGVYAPYSAGFELQTAAVPARYDGTTFSLVRADDATADQLAGYLSSITAVKVSGTSYAASGRGAVVIILENGAVDLSAAPFAGMKAGDTYEIEVIATGYSKNLTFTIEISATA